MLYDVKTPKEYMDLLEADWRKEKLAQVRAMIKKNGPKLEEGIEYKMLSYSDGNKSIFNLNAQKGYVSLYVGTIDKVPDARDLLKDFSMGKGCIRIKKSVKLSETGIETFIQKVIEIVEQGGDTDC